MSSHRAGEECPSLACRMLPLRLLLLLLLSGATMALPLEGSLNSHDSHSRHPQEVAETERKSLLTFLAWWYEWTAGAAPFVGGEAREVSRRQEGPPRQQSARPDKVPCKNFFWKTFSSCK